MLKLTFIAKKF